MLAKILRIAFGLVFPSSLILDNMLSTAFGFVFSANLILDEMARVAFGFVSVGTLIFNDILWMTDMDTIDRNDVRETVLLTLWKWSLAL